MPRLGSRVRIPSPAPNSEISIRTLSLLRMRDRAARVVRIPSPAPVLSKTWTVSSCFLAVLMRCRTRRQAAISSSLKKTWRPSATRLPRPRPTARSQISALARGRRIGANPLFRQQSTRSQSTPALRHIEEHRPSPQIVSALCQEQAVGRMGVVALRLAQTTLPGSV